MTEIVETAAKVFREKGYDAGSLDDVALELNLRKASLYYYVRSKAELLYRIFDKTITSALDSLEECLSIEDPKERLAALIRHQATMVASESSFFTVFFDQRPRLAHDYDSEILAKERQYLHIYQEAVASAVDCGALPAMRARYGAQAILGMTSWIYKWFDPLRDDPQVFADACVDMVLAGGNASKSATL
ncbi:MAG: TetR/AcrR family transcriptional regulator [Acidimicrobiales bacterium]